MRKARFQLKPIEHIGVPETKQNFNKIIFTEVAPRYDFITKALSFGRDTTWKRILISQLPELTAPVCLDLACGTGDITRLLAIRYPDGKVTGLDLTPAMLERARQLTDTPSIQYCEGTMASLPANPDSIDVVTGGYALRNTPDLNQTIDEIVRVLRIGGTATFLDFSKPPGRLGQQITQFLLKLWGGLWGVVLHGNPDVYGYIADSLRLYPHKLELRKRFLDRGFKLKTGIPFFGGILEIVQFEKGKVESEEATEEPVSSPP
ncbi:MAG: class I SAM-dependent methyltransferase [Pontiella sp.]